MRGTGPSKLTQLLDTILSSFIDLVQCDGGSIYTLRRKPSGRQVLVFEVMRTRSLRIFEVPDSLKNQTFPLDETSLVGRTALHRSIEILESKDLSPAPGFDERPRVRRKVLASRPDYETRSMLSAALITPRGELVGVVQLVNKRAPGEAGGKAERFVDFEARDRDLLSIAAGHSALAIENSLLLEEQEALLEGFVSACVKAVDSRDKVTAGHSHRVADYTLELAEGINREQAGPLRDLKFTDAQLREIKFAAVLHDIGKIAVREDVLNKEKKLFPHELEVIEMRLKMMRSKLLMYGRLSGIDMRIQLERIEDARRKIRSANEPSVLPKDVADLITDLQSFTAPGLGLDEDEEPLVALTGREASRLCVARGSLSPEERIEIEKHVTATYDILKLVPWGRGMENVAEIAYRHHEKLDGSGYPLKCTEHQIPVQSRIITICDIFDALTADDRPYKVSVPVDKALAILESDVKDGKLDGNLFRVFRQLGFLERIREHQQTRRRRAA